MFSACAGLVLLAQAALPPLPKLLLDSLPVQARDAIARPYKAASDRPDDADAVGNLGRALHAWNQWGTAHEAYIRAQALAAEREALAERRFEWFYLDGAALQRLARHDEAASRFEQAVRLRPDYLPARVKLAEAQLDAGDLDGAQRLFEPLLNEPAAKPAAEFGLGRIEAARGHHDKAVEHLERAVALFPEWGAAHYALALSYRAIGRADAARDALQKHQQFGTRWPAVDDPVLSTVSSLRNDAQTQLDQGLKLAEGGDTAGAIAAHEAALAIDPQMAQAHANLISLYARERNWAKAEEHYRAVLALGVNLGDAHYDYGVLLAMQERWVDAAEAFRKATVVNPRHARAHNNLGQALERQQDLANAELSYRRAVESDPAFRLARFNLGRLLIASGKNDEAIQQLQKLTEPRDAEAPRYLFGLATAYIRAGRKDDGIKWATDAAKLARDFGQTDLAAAIERDLSRIR